MDHWEITDKNTEIDNLINDKDTILRHWIGERDRNIQKQWNDLQSI